jgi:PIN domain nuclease of toxin-antitoxin system
VSDVVLDASVIIAAVLEEPGGERAVGHASPPLVSAVNYAEALTRLTDIGRHRESVHRALDLIPMEIVGFEREQAESAAELRSATRPYGLSLGDRACLALAISRKAKALTADRAWRQAELPIEVELIR